MTTASMLFVRSRLCWVRRGDVGDVGDVGYIEVSAWLVQNERNRFTLAIEIPLSPVALGVRNECGDSCVGMVKN